MSSGGVSGVSAAIADAGERWRLRLQAGVSGAVQSGQLPPISLAALEPTSHFRRARDAVRTIRGHASYFLSSTTGLARGVTSTPAPPISPGGVETTQSSSAPSTPDTQGSSASANADIPDSAKKWLKSMMPLPGMPSGWIKAFSKLPWSSSSDFEEESVPRPTMDEGGADYDEFRSKELETASPSTIDWWAAVMTYQLPKSPMFFQKGWGGVDIALRNPFFNAKPYDIRIVWTTSWKVIEDGRGVARNGIFISPVADDLPPESRVAYIKVVKPLQKVEIPSGETELSDHDENVHTVSGCPMILLLPQTGDTGYEFRMKRLAQPLLNYGIGSVMLESPYYGLRKPESQHRHFVQSLGCITRLGLATVEEGRALCNWLHKEGHPVAVGGFSMGASMSLAVAAHVPFACGVAAMVPADCGSTVFVRGEMKQGVDWPALKQGWPQVQHIFEAYWKNSGKCTTPISKESNKLSADQPLAQTEGGNADHSQSADNSTAEELPTSIHDALDAVLRLPSDIPSMSPPKHPGAVIIVGGAYDAYIPPEYVRRLAEAWPGSQLRWEQCGHIEAIVRRSHVLVRAIVDSLRCLTSGEGEVVSQGLQECSAGGKRRQRLPDAQGPAKRARAMETGASVHPHS